MNPWREKLRQNEKLSEFYLYLASKSERTQTAYENRLKQLCDFFQIEYEQFDPKEVTQEKYNRFFREKTKNHKHSTVNTLLNIFNILNKIYNLGLKVTLLKENDIESDYITFRELQEIINKADKEVSTLCAFLFCTGLRIVSLSKIKKKDLFLNSENPFIKNVYLKGGRHEDFYILFPDICVPLMKWYMQYKSQQLADYSENPYVFVSQQGTATRQYIYSNVRKASKIIKRSVSPKMFRTGLAVHLKQMGVQSAAIQMTLGHRDLKTTVNTYSKFDKSDVLRELDMKGNRPSNSNASTRNTNSIQAVNQEVCPFCNGVVDHEMLICPHCLRDIRRICPTCKHYLNIEWTVCPYCKYEFHKEFKKAKIRKDLL
ncbi:MAG: tyrosine-type recombinase/integrase [Theionarchaea archaeon]|nr:tyrosine-type recombinase/integrase [Theionarchaea archaeon]